MTADQLRECELSIGEIAFNAWQKSEGKPPRERWDDAAKAAIDAHCSDPSRIVDELAARFPLVVVAKHINATLPGLINFVSSLSAVDDKNTRPTAVASHAEGEAVAWMHTLHMELGQSSTRLSLSIENPFGIAGEDYSSSYSVTSRPLYAHPARSGDEAMDADYREIARLIGQIFFYGDFKAETHNERLLEALLRKTGNFHETQAQADAAMAARGVEK